MEELIVAIFDGYSFAKILFVIGGALLLALFVALVVANTVRLFATKEKTIRYLNKLDNSLGLAFLIAFGYIIVAIIMSYMFNLSLI